MPFEGREENVSWPELDTLHVESTLKPNFFWNFEWKAMHGDDYIDLSGKLQFTMVMKNPFNPGLVIQ